MALAAPAITTAEADTWSTETAAIVTKRDKAGFAQRFNIDTFSGRVLQGIPDVTPQLAAGFRTGFGPSIAKLLDNVQPSDQFTYLHSRPVGDEQHVIFRLVGNAGMNYWDVTITRGVDGATKIDDIYFAATGEPLSETTRRLILRVLTGSDPKKGPSNAELAAIADVGKATQAVAAGKGDEALRIFDTLPPKYQRDKATQVVRIMAAANCSDPKKLDEVADEFKKRFGDDPAGDLMLVDVYLNRKNFTEALACIDRLNTFVNFDPYLDVMRANISRMAGRLGVAREVALHALETDPSLYDAVDSLLVTSLEQKDFDEAKRWLIVAESDFGVRFNDDLNKAAMFDEFRASPQYQAWLKERPAKAEAGKTDAR